MRELLDYLEANGFATWIVSGGGVEFIRAFSDDAAREFAYDRGSHVGTLERGVDEAGARGWSLISVKSDWKVVYTPEK